MRLLFCGDVLGKAGRRAVRDHLPGLIERLRLDFVILNGENAAHGFGITPGICDDLFALGVDVITTGNHVWDQREIIGHIDGESRLLRPLNLPAGTPGRGARVYTARNGARVLVVQVMGRLFMGLIDDPFAALRAELARHRLGVTVAAAVVDMHAEASSEKMALGHFADGQVSMVVGSHTHMPTADAQILPGGTAFQGDAGMCGDYDSVIGMQKEVAVARFLRNTPTGRLEPAGREATFCAVYLETDDRGGLATRIAPVRLGGRLAATVPSV